MAKFSEVFGLGRNQAELDFVDVELGADNQLFVDPLGLAQRVDEWSVHAHRTLVRFFQTIIDRITSNRADDAQKLLYYLSEPNETRLGYSKGRPKGAGIGGYQAVQIYERLAASSAVKTGFITSLEDCELMIEGISHDKISDLTTNVIRRHLVDYSRNQCELHNVPTRQVALPPMFNPDSMEWYSEYVSLPVSGGIPVLLVPKAIVRLAPVYDSKTYYDDFVIEYLRAEALQAKSGLVTALQRGKSVVYRVFKKDVKEAFPFAKEFLFEFSKKNPKVLQDFRLAMAKLEQYDRSSDVDDPSVESDIADALEAVLKRIETGNAAAGQYHSLMVGILEFLFYPHLAFPYKEREINDGRKRIDIVMENCARQGLFFELPNVRRLPCPYVLIECKNYSTDIENPELDQLAGRMSVNRGMFGLLCCRHFEDRERFVARCRDTFNAGLQQLIVPLDDETIVEMLHSVSRGQRSQVETRLRQLIAEVWIA